MVKKMVRTATAALAMTSMFAMTAFAADPAPWNTNNGETEVPGDAWVVEPTVEVELPGDLAFGINPLRLQVDDGTETGTKAQIVSSDYVVTNYSNIPVVVNAKTKMEVAANVEIVSSTPSYGANSNELDASSTAGNKAIWLVQLYPTGDATFTDGVTKLTTTALADKATTAGAGKVLSATDAEVNFMLDAFDGETLAATNVSGFQFAGAVDPNAAFAEGDVKVKTVFKLTTLSENQKADYEKATDIDASVHETVVKAK